MKTEKAAYYRFLIVLAVAAGIQCGGGGAGDTSTNDLSAAFPTDLAITSPFATESALEVLVKFPTRSQTGAADEEIPLYTFDSKKEALAQRLVQSEIGGCNFNVRLFAQPPEVTCYGPPLAFTNHPDAFSGPPPTPTPNGTLPPGDVGIWKELEECDPAAPPPGRVCPERVSEPCVTAKVNNLMQQSQAQVDFALDLLSGMLCVANVKGKDEVPSAPGEDLDLTGELAAADLPVTVDLAHLERGDDTTDGDPVYDYHLLVAGQVPAPGGGTKSVDADITLRHISLNADNSAYRGKLYYTIEGDLSEGLCNGSGVKMEAYSVLYNRTEEGLLRYRVQRAQYCDAAAVPFDADNDLDPAEWDQNYFEILVNTNTTDGTGAFSVAWQAGSQDGKTRVFNADLNDNTAGERVGCGYFGFGPAVGQTAVGSIEGMICNWAGPNGYIFNPTTPTASVQRQCITFNETTSLFESNATQLDIVYAPTIACETVGTGPTFTGAGVTRQDAITPDLYNLTSYQSDWTAPSAPDPL